MGQFYLSENVLVNQSVMTPGVCEGPLLSLNNNTIYPLRLPSQGCKGDGQGRRGHQSLGWAQQAGSTAPRAQEVSTASDVPGV